jgi:hypothetical protein
MNIFRAWGILLDQRADNGEDGEQNEKKDRELEGTEKIKDDIENPFFFMVHCDLRSSSIFKKQIHAGPPAGGRITEGGQVFEISNIYGRLLSSKFALKRALENYSPLSDYTPACRRQGF